MKTVNLPEFRIVDYDESHKIQYRKRGRRTWRDLPYGLHSDHISASEHKKCLVKMIRSFNNQYHSACEQHEKIQSLIFGSSFKFGGFKNNKQTVIIRKIA